MKFVLIFFASILTWTVPAIAATEAALVEIPFSPPLARPLRYEVVTEKNADAKSSHVTLVQDHVFRRAGDGYTVTITNLSASDGTTALTRGSREAALMTGPVDIFAPITLELDSLGTPLRVANWEAERAKLIGVPALIAAQQPTAERQQALEVARRAVAPFLRANAEQAVDIYVKHWPSVLGWGGTAYPEGEPQAYAGEVPSPIGSVMLPQEGTVMLERGTSGEYRLTLREVTDPETAREVVVAYLAGLGEPGDPKYDAMMAQARSTFAVFKYTTSMEVSLSSGTGIVESAVVEKRFEFADGGGSERAIIRRLD